MKNKFIFKSQINDKKNEINNFSKITQSEIIFNYFKNNPNREIRHPEIVDFTTKQYKQLTGNEFRDPDRAIRKLYQQGLLIKVSKGIYKYDPDFIGNDRTKNLFSEKDKKKILQLGNYKCAICGLGIKDGEELHVDHIIPMEKGGTNDIKNGQVLCSKHNFLKKNFQQTETGKRFFLNLRRLLKNQDSDMNLNNFINEVLEVYEKYNINGHIDIEFKKNKN
ncbi:HNH endonuclease [Spiroplasma citri]|uniref:HNH endonuclease n=1 Tax=Spiroplasma citri TaxID=2133 RepID=UPI0013A0A2A8|nr:HNH endonuclease signature motif containing protein [Spiroplasma citri]QIA67731.1 HNH endonuclease [Spiroplasma citri]QIA73305.1 HNH endonuclease [Spiroplasma citri]